MAIGLVSFAVLVGASLCVLVFARVGRLHGSTFRLYAFTGEARGVIRGSEVWLGGQKVGVVKDIQFMPAGRPVSERVLISMDVLSSAKQGIRNNSTAQVRSGGTLIRRMALREFTDQDGRQWTVWDVYPTLAERRRRNAGPPPGTRERRRHVEQRLALREGMTHGWLAFEARDGERRRLAPIPADGLQWTLASEHELRAWLQLAKPVPPARRLIE